MKLLLFVDDIIKYRGIFNWEVGMRVYVVSEEVVNIKVVWDYFFWE